MSNKAVGAGSSGPPAEPELCLLHLNFKPCPFCVPAEPAPGERAAEPLDEVEALREIEAAAIDTTPRRRRPRS